MGVRERIGQREQPSLLLGEHVDDPPLGPALVRTHVGNLVEEGEELGVAAIDVTDGAPGEEAVAEVANGSLHLAFLLRLSHPAELEAVAPTVEEHEQRSARRVEAQDLPSDRRELVKRSTQIHRTDRQVDRDGLGDHRPLRSA